MRRAASTYEATTNARRKYAENIFDIGTVAASILDRAEEGYRLLRINQEYPFDLSTTDAAQALEEWLEHEGYRYAWKATPEIVDPFRPSSEFEYPELVIVW